MNKEKEKKYKLDRKKKKIRAKISGTKDCPRLSVFRSSKEMYLQLIDDSEGKTLISAYTKELKESKSDKTQLALALGGLMAEKAKKKKIEKIVFDRGGYKYHGRVKAAAEGMRKGGLKF
ncbi:50S ribosomal protein L18 [Candidatus Falkowbacteria bacterium]|nr:MAG: 50S ribosomal protein L18 [Candidatus Falkowbacteria bacterium]